MSINDILYNSIILPIQHEESYTVLGTVIYALVALALLFLIWKLMKNQVKFDFKFFISLLPFIFLGASLRAFVDHDFLPRTFWLISPGLYLLIAGVFFLCLAASLLVEKIKRIKYWKASLFLGLAILVVSWIYVAEKIHFQNSLIFIICISAFLVISSTALMIFKKFKLDVFKNKLSFSAIASQVFDGANTSIILATIGGYEKHPIPSFLIEKFGSWIFLPVKIVIALIAVYIICTQVKDKELRNLLLIAIAVLGFSQGLRNLISVVLV